MVTQGAEAHDRGRGSVNEQAWEILFSRLSEADREAPLKPEGLQQLAMAAHLTGREAESAESLTRAHQGYLAQGDTKEAVRCAFWLGFTLLNNGESAQASGWFARARRLLDEGDLDCVEQGYMLLPAAIRSVHEGNVVAAHAMFVQAASIGARFRDVDLVTSARMGQGRALIRQGEVARGLSLLDEAMIAVTAGEISPVMVGGVYCSVLEACSEILDLRRAQEWTSALERWYASQPDIVPYRGQCIVRRAEILQLHGDWPSALQQAQQACQQLSQPTPNAALGSAFYRRAEIHRLRGEFAEAEEAYRQANQWERTPQPGYAQFRLAQGQIEAANTAIRHVAEAVRESGQRARVLDAYVEIVLAAHDVPAARAAADELEEISTHLNAPMVDAMWARAEGAVLLAEKNARGAHTALRRALTVWSDLAAPYETARVRVLLALSCRELGDHDTADLEFAAAREVFELLGAAPGVAQVEALSRKKAAAGAVGPLTGREVEILRLVASGMTNRAIAGKLRISEKTVARHLSNIFTKLDLPSRAAATAYAYKQNLV